MPLIGILALLCLNQPAVLIIGEHYTDALPGLALYKDAENSVSLRIGWVGADGKLREGYNALLEAKPRFGPVAPSGAYQRIDWQVEGAKVQFEWGLCGSGVAVARLTADKTTKIVLRLGPGWPPSVPTFRRSGAAVEALTSGHPLFSLRVDPLDVDGYSAPDAKTRERAPALDVGNDYRAICTPGPGHPVYLSMGTQPPDPNIAPGLLDAAAMHYDQTRAAASGDWDDFVSPMANQLGHSRVFSPETSRLAHIVSRGWCLPDGQVLFCWDSFFNGLLSSIENPEAGRDTVRAILAAQLPNGLVPNFAGRGWGVSQDRSQPPVGALCVWKMHERAPDKAFLREVYPKLLKWHEWWFAGVRPHRDGNHDGLLEWGSETDDVQNARFESGLDDSPMFDAAAMSSTSMTMNSTDLSALWAMDAEYLARIATVLGKVDDAKKLEADHDGMAARIDEQLWSESVGAYCYRYWWPQPAVRTIPTAGLFATQQGPGFHGQYFHGQNLKNLIGERQDPEIAFQWDGKSPFQPLIAENYSVRWTSIFTAPKSASYLFSTTSDDGVRLWVDGKLVIDDWKVHGTATTSSPPIPMDAGSQHAVKLEFFQAGGGSNVSLGLKEADPSIPRTVFLNRLSPLNFYPLIAGAPSQARAKRTLDLFFRPDKFNGEFVCPTIARDDPAFPLQGYWRGTIWGPTSYLVYQGLRRYATDKQRTEYARKSVALFMKNWNKDGTCHENFNGITGEGRSDPHYTWGALLCLIGIEELCDIEPDGRLRLNGASGATIRIRHFLLKGRKYDLQVEPNSAVLSLGGQKIAEVHGRVERFRLP